MNDIAFAATLALLLAATGASAQTPDACQKLQLTDAECRNLAAEQAKERTATAKPAQPRRPRDPALGKREQGTIKQGDTIIQYKAL